MKTVLLWNEQTDYASEVREWLGDFEHDTGKAAEIRQLDPETKEGTDFAVAYDILQYPAIVVIDDDDGRIIKMWKGTPMPQIDEVSYWM
ncbi:hypothetical protein IKW75_01300 [Candidatus Saccharibacteria bacterium]|nr:hypothetical protein [Candidatus Saccharibacteria bacterium]